MVRTAKLLLSISIFCFFFSGFSQDPRPGMIEVRKEVADSIGAFYFYDSAFAIVNPVYRQVDTSLHHSHHYQALLNHGRTFASLGNTGLAYYNMIFDYTLPSESQFGIRSYDAYRFTPSSIPYYKLNVPFTVLAYTTGRHREQVFTGRHYQQVRRDLGVGVQFNIYNSMGAYIRQKSDNASIAFQALYRTKSKRYGIAGNFINNRFIHRENGGLFNPLQFEQNLESDRGRISTRLSSAENRWRESNTYFKQYFHLSRSVSDQYDTVHSTGHGFGTVSHKFNYQRLAQIYDDRNPRSGFYREILIDSVRTTDSLVLHTVLNELNWSLPLLQTKSVNLTINTGISHIFMHYRMGGINNKYNQLIPNLNPELRIGEHFLARADIKQITGDFRNGDRQTGIELFYNAGKRNNLTLNLNARKSMVSPGLFYQLYNSNHFAWERKFDKQQFDELTFSGRVGKHKAGISYYGINGYAFLDSLAHPAWFDKPFRVLSAFINSRLEWRRFVFDNRIRYQYSSDYTALQLPELIVNSTLSYELDLFEGTLRAMGGVEVFYNTAWHAPAYMPALRTFYYQDRQTTGNYPYVDLFLNFRIKRARIFLLMQHVNEGILNYSYYMIPGYPMPDRAFKFGVNWIFYD